MVKASFREVLDDYLYVFLLPGRDSMMLAQYISYVFWLDGSDFILLWSSCMRTTPEMFQSSPGQLPGPIQPLAMPTLDHHPEPPPNMKLEPEQLPGANFVLEPDQVRELAPTSVTEAY